MHAKVRAGDAAAFRAVFNDHARAVYGHAYRVTGDWAAAEDVVSLTFLEAWRLRDRVRDENETLRPWLLGIAVNVLRNRGRALRRHRAAMARAPVKDTVPDFADEIVARMADGERLAAAKAALAKLRRADREVFELCVWAGLGYPEAAEALGVAEGTVRSRLFRARKRLRELAENELREGRERAAKTLQRPAGDGQRQDNRTVSVRPVQEGTR